MMNESDRNKREALSSWVGFISRLFGVSRVSIADDRATKALTWIENYIWDNEIVHIPNSPKTKKAHIKQLRKLVLDYYGGKCACCGESHWECLCLDHINGDGKRDRALHGVGYNFYRWVIRSGFPDHLQVLCHNCNMSKAFYGYSPYCSDRKENDNGMV